MCKLLKLRFFGLQRRLALQCKLLKLRFFGLQRRLTLA